MIDQPLGPLIMNSSSRPIRQWTLKRLDVTFITNSTTGGTVKAIVKPNEFGIHFVKQRFVNVLEPGEYTYRFFPAHHQVQLVPRHLALQQKGIQPKALASEVLNQRLETKVVSFDEVAFHFVDGLFQDVLVPGSYSYLKTDLVHTFVLAKPSEVLLPDHLIPMAGMPGIEKDLLAVNGVPNGCVGILLVNGNVHSVLNPGKYAWFTKPNTVSLKIVDTRPTTLTITGQELLTRDKVPLRLNVIVTYRIIDPLRSAQAIERLDDAVYLRTQLALRGLISDKTLDELLIEKQVVGSAILDELRLKEGEFGVYYEQAGIKDIILPGEIKDILNTILIAEKRAMANVITRREETASTRSLLNTAKLMDENATLYRLKELETLERLFDKVGTISLSSNSGLLDQLSGLLKPKP